MPAKSRVNSTFVVISLLGLRLQILCRALLLLQDIYSQPKMSPLQFPDIQAIAQILYLCTCPIFGAKVAGGGQLRNLAAEMPSLSSVFQRATSTRGLEF